MAIDPSINATDKYLCLGFDSHNDNVYDNISVGNSTSTNYYIIL